MSPVTLILVNCLSLVVLTGLVTAAIDLTKLATQALHTRQAKRACRRGWDWNEFERELARYVLRGGGRRDTAHPR
jgi:hypothetical protein